MHARDVGKLIVMRVTRCLSLSTSHAGSMRITPACRAHLELIFTLFAIHFITGILHHACIAMYACVHMRGCGGIVQGRHMSHMPRHTSSSHIVTRAHPAPVLHTLFTRSYATSSTRTPFSPLSALIYFHTCCPRDVMRRHIVDVCVGVCVCVEGERRRDD